MKGKKRVERKIEKAVDKYLGLDLNIKLSNVWQCIPESKSNKVFMSPFVDEIDEIQDNVWLEWIKETFDFECDNVFMISLLHEAGHLATWTDFKKFHSKDFVFSQDETKVCDDISRDLCAHGMANTKAFKDNCRRYNAIPIEKIATQWAVNFYKNYKKDVKKCYNKICKILIKFYKKNGVTD